MSGHTNHNAFKILGDVREAVGEFSVSMLQGTDWSGKYSNTFLDTQINAAQARMYALIMKSDVRDIFYESASITVTSSVITLPWDFGRILQLEDENGYLVYPSTARITPVQGQEGSKHLYYRDGSTLVLNKSGVTNTYTLKYYRRPRRLAFGRAGAGSGALALYMEDSDATIRKNDYYNGFTIDNYTQGLSTSISDFVGATRAATTAAITWAAADYYGTVPEFPVEFHLLIAPLAALLARVGNPLETNKPTKIEYDLWSNMFMEIMVAFSNMPDDVPIESLFCDFGFGSALSGYNVPGQGYVIP